MTFKAFTDEVLDSIFPFGRPENLQAAHRRMVIEALVELQRMVDCLQNANTSEFAQCATYFNCGMTVLPQPRGQIVSIFTIPTIASEQPGFESDGDDSDDSGAVSVAHQVYNGNGAPDNFLPEDITLAAIYYDLDPTSDSFKNTFVWSPSLQVWF